ncbi:hypothetical protein JRO89_XS08G0036700 [Xanthoceras sorbifolium]|uniref:Cytochrome P450 n=1 Tax=Xanthoceras sorbifolium TaxID=99658 RepID=A0ABQ8HNH3_9ROSI|nr:hypothetical protein JRO89_XS08G0036700 [Xanthoceras sorbifolium]
MTCRMVFGKKYVDKEFDERGFKAVIQEGMKMVGTPNMGDYIPQIAPLDLHRVTKRMKAISKVFDVFFEKIINEHIQSRQEENRNKDFVDVMLGFMGSEETEYSIERDSVKALMLYFATMLAYPASFGGVANQNLISEYQRLKDDQAGDAKFTGG